MATRNRNIEDYLGRQRVSEPEGWWGRLDDSFGGWLPGGISRRDNRLLEEQRRLDEIFGNLENPQDIYGTLQDVKNRLDGRGVFEESGDWLYDLFGGSGDTELARIFENNPQLLQVALRKAQEAKEDTPEVRDAKNLQDDTRDLFRDLLPDLIDNLNQQKEDARSLRDESAKASQDTLKEYEDFKNMFKERLGMGDTYLQQSLQQARDYQKAPSVVDAMLSDAFQKQKSQLASAYAGRSGGGYLEDFNQQSDMMNKQIRDAGVAGRLQEDLQRKQMLMGALDNASKTNFNVGANLPFGMIGAFQNARNMPYSANIDMLNFMNRADANRMNLADRLFAWQSGQQNFASGENQRGLDNLYRDRKMQEFRYKGDADREMKKDKFRWKVADDLWDKGTEFGAKMFGA